MNCPRGVRNERPNRYDMKPALAGWRSEAAVQPFWFKLYRPACTRGRRSDAAVMKFTALEASARLRLRLRLG